jgi:hypothetical protein
MNISKKDIFISITKFHDKLKDLKHKFEWPSGLCKTCYPININPYVYKESCHPRCKIPSGTVNFARTDSYAKETGIYIDKRQMYRIFYNQRSEYIHQFGYDLRRHSNQY